MARGSARKAYALLQLVRLPNVVTAAADPLAAALAASGRVGASLEWGAAAVASLVGACVYAGGVVLNDCVDLAEDRLYRPDRPLPRGDVSLAQARRLAAAMFGIAAALAVAALPAEAVGVTLALISCVLIYDGWAKRVHVAGPLFMGACRGLNVCAGLVAVPGGIGELGWLGLLAAAHFAAVTYLAQAEERKVHVRHAVSVPAAAVAAGAVLVAHLEPLASRLLVAAYVAANADAAVRLLQEPVGARVHHAVKWGILSYGLVHLGVVAAWAGSAWHALLLGGVYAAALAAARWLKMT